MTSNSFGQPIGFPVSAWTERALPPRTAMHGRFCSVVPLDAAAHLDDLWQAYAAEPDQRNWTYLFIDRPETKAGLEVYLHTLQLGDDPLCHTVVDRETGRALGIASFMRIDPRMGTIEVGNINYGASLKRSPLATEAMYLMARRVFDELGYRRYEWKCDTLNAPSRSAAVRLGFVYEGLFRRAVVYKGRNRDTAWFSIIAEEWPGVRAGYETWLDSGNFDAAGRQRRSLAECRSGIRLG